MDKKPKITILDVARKAGISKGTVDRVLHNRGEVSRKSAEKVRKAIEELGYTPNLYASLLATRQDRRIAVLTPDATPGEYWSKLMDGFRQGSENAASFNVLTDFYTYDQYDEESFCAAAGRVLEDEPSGVILPPLFAGEALGFTQKLAQKGIPYVYVDSNLEEDENCLAYFGMPMIRSGELAAFLLTESSSADEVKDVLVVRIKRDGSDRSDPTAARREGFAGYMAAHFPLCTIHNVFIDPKDPESTTLSLDTFFKEHEDVKYVVMFNSRIHLISGYLRSHPLEGRRVVGFDNLDENLKALEDGYVSALLCQHTERQSNMALQTLLDYILMQKIPARRDNHMHIDILTGLNIEDY